MWNPRTCGEKIQSKKVWIADQGSPPHGRGKAERAAGRHRPAGITPAWAGKRLTRPAMTGTPRDHPRMGGEKLHLLLCVPAGYGSPPRRRGKVIVYITAWRVAGITPARRGKVRFAFTSAEITGITPAWAGKRDKPALILRVVKDHPRMGGEKCRLLAVVACPAGSPPRGRGKAGHGSDIAQRHGITPA